MNLQETSGNFQKFQEFFGISSKVYQEFGKISEIFAKSGIF
jgi:hypothetical protein